MENNSNLSQSPTFKSTYDFGISLVRRLSYFIFILGLLDFIVAVLTLKDTAFVYGSWFVGEISIYLTLYLTNYISMLFDLQECHLWLLLLEGILYYIYLQLINSY
jgi:hypothetical protein